ncbi:hypothetical protein PIB30_071401 [Stylosanthes scabra]|uniref:Uncharacterized protein n=1 Tax=Stylosanthes scabra TaxID=79078 RepID=A0ABU6URJ6_9FABA|nr:hypothetical protein [Stylosanthes scabra]
MIGAGKNGPPGKYERWLSSASSGSIGLAMITDRVQVQAWKVSEASVKISVCLAFSKVQVFRCMSRRTRGASEKEYKEHSKAMKEAMEKQKSQFEASNQYWHRINSKNEEKIDYLCWGIQQINPYLKARLPEDIPEWMQGNVQAGRGRFSDGMSPIPRNCWLGASSASMNKVDKGKGKAEEEGGDERGKKKAWEARDKDLNE